MSSVAKRGSHSASIPQRKTEVSVYERVSGMLVALVVLFGFLALSLFAIWLTRVITIKPKSTPTIPIELKGEGAISEGVAREFEEPGVEELADVQEPQLADAMEAVTSAASSIKARVQAVDGNASQMGTGEGLGDARAKGAGGGGTGDAIPEQDRWELNYATASVKAYADQLDFFKIELGAVHRSKSDIYYARQLSQAKPVRRSGYRDEESRIYFSHLNKKLRQYDRVLLEKASIDTTDKLIVQFYPVATHQLLLNVERKALGTKSWESLRKTVFGVRGSGAGYEYFVIRQEFR